MTTYSIKAGQKNFRPFESPCPIFGLKGYEVEFMFHPGGWSSLQEWDFDKDWYDKQKLAGVTRFITRNNRQSSIIAFSFGEQQETYEVCGYTNHRKADWDFTNSIMIPSGKVQTAKAIFDEDGYVQYIMNTSNQAVNTKMRFDVPRVVRRIGTYPGGLNNSPGPYGGRAFKDMKIDIKFKLIK